jgi:hypothetical protein
MVRLIKLLLSNIINDTGSQHLYFMMFKQKPLGMHRIRSKLFSLPLSKLHIYLVQLMFGKKKVTNPNSYEYKLTAIVLDWWKFRFDGFVMKDVA